MKHAHYIVAGATIGASLFLAFGPLRHRVPRVFRHGAKFSVAAKLLLFAAIAGIAAYHAMTDDIDDPRPPILFTSASAILTVVALYVATRKTSPRQSP